MPMTRPQGAPKVLFLSGLQIYPPYSGGHLRSYALANALSRHGVEVFVYSLAGRKNDYLALRRASIQAWPEGIAEYVDRGPLGFLLQYASHALALPPVWLTAYLRAVAASPGERLLPPVLRERLAWCDVVIADFPFVHPIFSTPSAQGRIRVLSTHNVEHRLHEDRLWHRRRVRRAVRAIELAAVGRCDILVSCCVGDAEFFAATARVRRSVVVPNGIDVRRFRGIAAHRSTMRQELGIADDTKLFLFTASRGEANQEAFDYLVEFARSNSRSLAEQKIHILVVGGVASAQVRFPGFTATGKVAVVEPYFAAADVGLNPVWKGAGTNLKTCEFIALRLPVLTTRFGARGYVLEDGKTAFLFDKDTLAPVLSLVRRLFDEDPSRLRQMADAAYAQNENLIDMDTCARALVDAMSEERERSAGLATEAASSSTELVPFLAREAGLPEEPDFGRMPSLG
jgi:glycosyltransferase involved in cell wall biosynthesis